MTSPRSQHAATSPGAEPINARAGITAKPRHLALDSSKRLADLKRAITEGRLAANVTQNELAVLYGTKQPAVSAHENSRQPNLPTLAHAVEMPDAMLDVVLQRLAAIRSDRGLAMRRWVEVATDERDAERESRATQLAETVRHLTVEIASLAEQVGVMTKGVR